MINMYFGLTVMYVTIGFMFHVFFKTIQPTTIMFVKTVCESLLWVLLTFISSVYFGFSSLNFIK